VVLTKLDHLMKKSRFDSKSKTINISESNTETYIYLDNHKYKITIIFKYNPKKLGGQNLHNMPTPKEIIATIAFARPLVIFSF